MRQPLEYQSAAPGEIVNARITDYQNYDLVAEIPQEKRRSLKVVGK